MMYLQFAALIITAAGLFCIGFAKQLAILYEGPQYSMSDLGFVVSGMMLVGIGIVLFLITLIARFLRR